MRRITEASSSTHSSAFRASFAKGEIEVRLMADKGADDNLMPKNFLKKYKK